MDNVTSTLKRGCLHSSDDAARDVQRNWCLIRVSSIWNFQAQELKGAPSTSSRAGDPAASMVRRTSAMSLVTPAVDVTGFKTLPAHGVWGNTLL